MTNTPTDGYVLRRGAAGYERLLVLARDRWPDTLALLRRAGIAPGMRCADLGCGPGAVTRELARLVGPTGRAVGLDLDEVSLQRAREVAVQEGLGNVEFRAADLRTWTAPAQFDLVYSRALLHHLPERAHLIEGMWAAVAPGGRVVIEDADFDGWCCDPPSEALDFFVRAYGETVRRRGGDPTFGRTLYRCFRAAGIPDPQFGVVQSVRLSGESKTLAWSTLEASREAIVATGVATAEAVDAALASLARATADPSMVILGPRMFQIWAIRPPEHPA
jgi:ubiquinone/menaquinone biosynthesis C-methylase UbiE